MRRQIYIGNITISVVDVVRSEIAHQQEALLSQQQQQQQQQLGMGGWLVKSPLGSFSQFSSPQSKRGSENNGRLSISSLHRGIQAISASSDNSNSGCSHTAWYTLVTKAGLLSSLARNTAPSNTKPAANKNNGKGKPTATASSNAIRANTAASSSSYVTALSSRGPREDVDAPQVRLTLTVKSYQPSSLSNK